MMKWNWIDFNLVISKLSTTLNRKYDVTLNRFGKFDISCHFESNFNRNEAKNVCTLNEKPQNECCIGMFSLYLSKLCDSKGWFGLHWIFSHIWIWCIQMPYIMLNFSHLTKLLRDVQIHQANRQWNRLLWCDFRPIKYTFNETEFVFYATL